MYMKKKNQKLYYPKLLIRRFKRISTTCWISHYYVLCTVLKIFNYILETLQNIRETERSRDRSSSTASGGLLKYFKTKLFLLTAFSFETMFKIMEKTSQNL